VVVVVVVVVVAAAREVVTEQQQREANRAARAFRAALSFAKPDALQYLNDDRTLASD